MYLARLWEWFQGEETFSGVKETFYFWAVELIKPRYGDFWAYYLKIFYSHIYFWFLCFRWQDWCLSVFLQLYIYCYKLRFFLLICLNFFKYYFYLCFHIFFFELYAFYLYFIGFFWKVFYFSFFFFKKSFYFLDNLYIRKSNFFIWRLFTGDIFFFRDCYYDFLYNYYFKLGTLISFGYFFFIYYQYCAFLLGLYIGLFDDFVDAYPHVYFWIVFYVYPWICDFFFILSKFYFVFFYSFFDFYNTAFFFFFFKLYWHMLLSEDFLFCFVWESYFFNFLNGVYFFFFDGFLKFFTIADLYFFFLKWQFFFYDFFNLNLINNFQLYGVSSLNWDLDDFGVLPNRAAYVEHIWDPENEMVELDEEDEYFVTPVDFEYEDFIVSISQFNYFSFKGLFSFNFFLYDPFIIFDLDNRYFLKTQYYDYFFGFFFVLFFFFVLLEFFIKIFIFFMIVYLLCPIVQGTIEMFYYIINLNLYFLRMKILPNFLKIINI